MVRPSKPKLSQEEIQFIDQQLAKGGRGSGWRHLAAAINQGRVPAASTQEQRRVRSVSAWWVMRQWEALQNPSVAKPQSSNPNGVALQNVVEDCGTVNRTSTSEIRKAEPDVPVGLSADQPVNPPENGVA